jgi:hypothetical protein
VSVADAVARGVLHVHAVGCSFVISLSCGIGFFVACGVLHVHAVGLSFIIGLSCGVLYLNSVGLSFC